ncbi:GMC oxidoreductase [Crepidotus variabilis]|uniref:pyranose dehydrogenase (acceptor) n=1 Tax=Crepidotus variabilis TaxID=179855 RepID=A0A9P6EGS7_9AGAR|nr:GMC oxidoreductase [Crepidotus variabilis]
MPILSLQEVVQKSFDYIVIGGGTAGLALAGRLSEEPTVSVLVLEAGQANLDDPKIVMPAQFGQTFGNPQYDWAFNTVKQKHTNNKIHLWSRGKALGGTSTMNFYCWSKPTKTDIDAIERLGNPGWNWTEFIKYSRKSESFHLPAQEQLDVYPHTYNPNFRGLSGPIHTSLAPQFHTIDKLMQETLVNKGIKPVEDPYGGDISGGWIASANIDPKGWKRSYSASGYLQPNLHRPNLNVLTDALVARIVFEDKLTPAADRTASAVEFLFGDGSAIHTVKANREVIVSAGTINSPKVLELSGIGQSQILSSFGLETLVDLPGVGENVQEHVWSPVSFELDDTRGVLHQTLDLLKNPDTAAKHLALYAEGKGLFRSCISSFSFLPIQSCDLPDTPSLIALAEKEAEAAKAQGSAGMGEQVDIWLEILKNKKEPDFEIVALPCVKIALAPAEPSKHYFTLLALLNHPLSRGTIHIQSKDPRVHPEIDPRYFERQIDLEIILQEIKYIRSWKETEPWKSGIVREMDPGPKYQTDDELREYIRNSLNTTWHTVGSCSMLPREKQGVVDPQLKVYGTSNVRVVDISIIPLHIAAHTQTSAYAIGEKAANIIKATFSGKN